MEIQGEQILAVPRARVWLALNDPAILQRCLPGCDTFEATDASTYRVALQASVGPVRARFAGTLHLYDVVAPLSYALRFEGSGGVAGFGKGTAEVTLDDAPGGTCLRYVAQAQVGGRLAQVGGRLIDGVTRRLADDFFSRFARELAHREGDEAGEPAAVAAAANDELPPGTGTGPATAAAAAAAAAASGSGTTPGERSGMPSAAPLVVPAVSDTPLPAVPPDGVVLARGNLIALIAAAVSVTAAAVAVLAAVVVVQFAR